LCSSGYIPGSGEICNFLDCGGGRAPNKKNVAGCPGYTGTGTYSPSFLTGFNTSPVSTTTPSAPATTSVVVTSDTTVATPSPSPGVDGGLTTLSGTVQTTGGALSNANPTSASSSSADTAAIAATGTSTASAASSTSTGNSAVKNAAGGGVVGAMALVLGSLL